MMTNLYDAPIDTRFNHLYRVMRSDRFLQMQGLSNEVPFFIFPFKPEEQNDIEKLGKSLITNLEKAGVRIRKANLYDIAIDLLKEAGIFEQILLDEKNITRKELLEDLKGVLDPEKYVVPAIVEKMEENPYDILFITGIGEVYPYIRSHNILNNLQRFANNHPTLLFYPGQYSFSQDGGSTLRLFNTLPNSRYYRAFNILEYQI